MAIDVNKSPLAPTDTLIKNNKATNVLKGLILLLLLVWIINDVSNRLFSVAQYNSYNMSLEQLQPIHKVQLSLSQFSQISTLYERFSIQDDTENNQQKTIDGLSLEEQALQKGNLTKMFAGDKMLELKAVIEQKNKPKTAESSYALVKISDVKTNKSEIISVLDQQQLLGFKVSIVNNIKIKLVRDTLPVQLGAAAVEQADIWLIMYQQQASGENVNENNSKKQANK